MAKKEKKNANIILKINTENKDNTNNQKYNEKIILNELI